jgi:hypothetical protein
MAQPPPPPPATKTTRNGASAWWDDCRQLLVHPYTCPVTKKVGNHLCIVSDAQGNPCNELLNVGRQTSGGKSWITSAVSQHLLLKHPDHALAVASAAGAESRAGKRVKLCQEITSGVQPTFGAATPQHKMQYAVAKYIVYGNHPLSTSEDELFRFVLKTFVEQTGGNPDLMPATYRKNTKDWINAEWECTWRRLLFVSTRRVSSNSHFLLPSSLLLRSQP